MDGEIRNFMDGEIRNSMDGEIRNSMDGETRNDAILSSISGGSLGKNNKAHDFMRKVNDLSSISGGSLGKNGKKELLLIGIEEKDVTEFTEGNIEKLIIADDENNKLSGMNEGLSGFFKILFG